jgi:anti-anti-sigma factor
MTLATVAVEETGDDTVRIAVAGEIDLVNATAVEQRITEAITNQLRAVTLDLTALEYIDSAGLRVLFQLASRLETLQIAIELVVAPRSSVRRLVDLSGLATAMPVRSAV